jgi:shikimate kinase
MPVITINGPIGSGPVSIGQMVSQQLELNFVDRLIFTQASKLVGKPVGGLIDKEQRVVRFRDRLGKFL